MELFSDEALAIAVPIVVYWVYSALYMVLGHSVDKYRLHPRQEEDSKNLVSKRDVVKGVLLQQLVQAAVAAAVFTLTGEGSSVEEAEDGGEVQVSSSTSYLTVARQLVVAMAVLDGWQYAWHRYMHLNRFLYRHVHSWHHRLVVPYAFGAQYNHPAEGLLLDTLGGALAFLALHGEGRRRPLRPVAARQRIPPLLLEQHGVPRRAPPATGQPLQLLAALLRDVGYGVRDAHALRRRGEGWRWAAGASPDSESLAMADGTSYLDSCDEST
ncbi:hypothetical protein ACP70R_001854 [Stipagrostis hirtigluma subsp. patula]